MPEIEKKLQGLAINYGAPDHNQFITTIGSQKYVHQIHTNIGNPQAVAYAVGKTYTEASSNAEQIIQAVNTHKDILTALMILVAECEAEIKAGIVSKKIFAMQNAKEAIKNTTGYEK